MSRYSTFLLFLFSAILSLAQDASADYNIFSKIPSEQLLSKGRNYFEKNEAGKALSCFMIVSERYDDEASHAESELRIRAMNNCGCVYKYFYFDYTQAYKYFAQAYELCEKLNHKELLPIILVNLGDLLNDYGIVYGSEAISKQAADLFDQCFKNAYENKNWELLTTSFFNLSNQNYDIDLTKYEQIFSEEIPNSTPDIEYIRLQYKGMKCIQQKKYAEARRLFEQQFGVVSARWQAERDTLSSIISIAKTYELEKNYEKEAEHLEKALQQSADAGLSDFKVGLCKQLSQCYRLIGDSTKQRQYHLQFLEEMEKMRSYQLNSIAELRYINELEKEEIKAKELTLRQRQQQIVILATFIVLLVVIVSAIILWRQNRKLHARNKSLFEKYSQILRAEDAEHELRKITETQDAKYSHSRLNDTQRETLIFRIQEIFDNADLICQQDFTLSQLAKLVDSNTTYVSQVINEKYDMTFSNLLGNYRVKEACRRINESTQYDNLTIEAIASNIGFKSRTAFINAFKREVGLTPSEYLRIAATSKEENK